DDEGLGHPVHPPFDGGAAVAVGSVGRERIAIAAEDAPCIVGLVLVIDADDAYARVRRQRHEQRRFLAARHAPRRPHIEHRHLALEIRAVEAGNRPAVALEAGKRRQIGPRGRMSDQGGRNARRIAGTEPQHEHRGEREKGGERDEHDHSAPPRARILVDQVLFSQVLFRQLPFDKATNVPSFAPPERRKTPCDSRAWRMRLKCGRSTTIQATSAATIAIAATYAVTMNGACGPRFIVRVPPWRRPASSSWYARAAA